MKSPGEHDFHVRLSDCKGKKSSTIILCFRLWDVLICGAAPRAFSRPGLFSYNRAARHPYEDKNVFHCKMFWEAVLRLGRFHDPGYLVIIAQLAIWMRNCIVVLFVSFAGQHYTLNNCLTYQNAIWYSIQVINKNHVFGLACFCLEMVLRCGAVPRAFQRPGLFGYNRAARPSCRKLLSFEIVLRCGAAPRAFSRPGLFSYNRAARRPMNFQKLCFALWLDCCRVMCASNFSFWFELVCAFHNWFAMSHHSS